MPASQCQIVPMRGRKVAVAPRYVVWAPPTHPSRSWAVGREIRPGCLKVVAYAELTRRQSGWPTIDTPQRIREST